MNISMKLTLARILATPVFVFFLSASFTGNYTLALVVFLCAMLTDYLDGLLARARGEVSDMGKLLDPLADKILISSAFICFIRTPHVSLPPWVVIIIVSREFAITGLRLLAAGKGLVLSAGRWGKHKTASQVITVSAILLYLCLYDYDPHQMVKYHPVIIALVGVTVLLTIFSGCFYLIKNRSCFTQQPVGDNPQERV